MNTQADMLNSVRWHLPQPDGGELFVAVALPIGTPIRRRHLLMAQKLIAMALEDVSDDTEPSTGAHTHGQCCGETS